MELTVDRVAAYMAEGAAHGRRGVSRLLHGEVAELPGDADRSTAAANFLAYVMYTVQLANGLHPQSSVDFVPGDDRGSELAREFLTAGTVEVCCDYCGQLMTAAMARAAAAQMIAVHGDSAANAHWEALSLALSGPPF